MTVIRILEKSGRKIYMATTKAKHIYSDVSFEEDCYIMFGKESAGIPEEILVENENDNSDSDVWRRFVHSILVILLQLFVRSTQAAGLSGTQSDGASSSFSLERWHGIGNCKGLFEKVLFFATFQMLNRYVGRKGKNRCGSQSIGRGGKSPGLIWQ